MPRKKKTCTHPGCDRPHLAKGYCTIHWRRNRDGSDMDAPIGAGRGHKRAKAHQVDEAPPSPERESDEDVVKRFRKLGHLLGLDPDRLLDQAQEECARGYLERIQAAALGRDVGSRALAPATTRSSGMVLARPTPVSSTFETDELDSPRRASAKDLKSGSAECPGCGGVATCHSSCKTGKYPKVQRVASAS